MIVTLTPVEPLGEAEAKFIAMSRVLSGLREYDWLDAEGEHPRVVGARLLASMPYRRSKVITKEAAGLLRIAWQTELTARLGDQLDDPGLRLATLQTLPVQAYYAVFSAGRALTHVAGSPRDAHAALHETFASEHQRRSVGVWRFSMTGDPKAPSTCILKPSAAQPSSFNPMMRRDDPSDYIWSALKTARRWRIERARERWLSDGNHRTKQNGLYKSLPPQARKKLLQDERPTTFMDYLYELRCATNYRSIDEYSVEIADDLVSGLHGGLMHLLDLGLLTYEGQIALYAGSANLRREFDGWARRVQPVGLWAAESGRARINALTDAGI